jgi:hypothetical protein
MDSERPRRSRVWEQCSRCAPGQTGEHQTAASSLPSAQRFNKRGLLNQRSPRAGRSQEKERQGRQATQSAGEKAL